MAASSDGKYCKQFESGRPWGAVPRSLAGLLVITIEQRAQDMRESIYAKMIETRPSSQNAHQDRYVYAYIGTQGHLQEAIYTPSP